MAGASNASLCSPSNAGAARNSITAEYHLNKRRWNTAIIDGSLPNQIIAGMVEGSYDLVVRGCREAAACIRLTSTRRLGRARGIRRRRTRRASL